MKLTAGSEFGCSLTFAHHEVLQTIIPKHSFDRLDDFLKDNPYTNNLPFPDPETRKWRFAGSFITRQRFTKSIYHPRQQHKQR